MKKRDTLLVIFSIIFGFFYYTIHNIDFGLLKNGIFSFETTRIKTNDFVEIPLDQSVYSSLASLRIKNIAGTIEIEESDSDQVKINISCFVYRINKEKAHKILKQLVIQKEEISNVLNISTGSIKSFPYQYVRFIIKIKAPQQIHISATNSFGFIKLYRLGEKVFLNESYGDILVKDVIGDIDVNCIYSNTTISNVIGNVRIKSEFSNLYLNKIDSINIESKYGNNKIKNISGRIDIKQSFGSISINNAGSIKIDSRNTKINAKKVINDVKIYGKNKDIELEDVNGNVIVNTENCLVSFHDSALINLLLSNAYGNVEIKNISGLKALLSVSNGRISINNLDMRERIDINSEYSDIYFFFSNVLSPSFSIKNSYGSINNSSTIPLKHILQNATKYYFFKGRNPFISINSYYGNILLNNY